MKSSAVLLVNCPDQKGVVARIADFIYRHNGNILFADEHGDAELNLFLMRIEFDSTDLDFPLTDFSRHFDPVAREMRMNYQIADMSYRPRLIILVSKYDHCLVDLLYRHQSGELKCEIPLIISNHEDNRPVADFYRVPYVTVAVTKDSKSQAEQQILKLLAERNPDFIVLARYMQILSNEFVEQYPYRIINIHHSFLPAFIGARPYHQAFARGVKLIGATSHYVTDVLDDGPIIEQDVVRISHRDTIEKLIEKGRDLEKVVLSRAVRWHIENRVLIYGNKTVVFH
ncbi:MAG: formyltetrahydrofolate deformylase [Acidobacteria bacterium]|jgi:formyltetrahydrofolate deformylase|nr:MAG: formyltetrahydrofolate deformylase [Acidobacteriota bacterium]